MIVDMTGRTLVRITENAGVDSVSFSDITASVRVGEARWLDDGRLEIPFDPEPSVTEQEAIIARLTTSNSNEETVRAQARALYADLRTIRNSTGTLSGAQLSNAVRVLARGEIGILRLLMREFDGTD